MKSNRDDLNLCAFAVTVGSLTEFSGRGGTGTNYKSHRSCVLDHVVHESYSPCIEFNCKCQVYVK